MILIFFENIFFFIISVRLANIMKELQLLPYQIHETEACRVSLYYIYLHFLGGKQTADLNECK